MHTFCAVHLAHRAAEHREVLRRDEHLAAVDRAVAGDDAVARRALAAIPKSCARCTAKGSVSTNEPASMRMSSRSRAVSLPLSCCFSAAPSPPGVRAAFAATPELLDAVLDGAFLTAGGFWVLAMG